MSEPVTSEKFAVGQSVRRLEDPRLLQGLGATPTTGTCRARGSSLSPMRRTLCAAAVQGTSSRSAAATAVRMRLPVMFTLRTSRGAPRSTG